MFDGFRREWHTRRTLRRLSKQRVARILNPGNVWAIEKAIDDDADTEAALVTCQMRGWIEIMHHAVPKGVLTPDGQLPAGKPFDSLGTIYRLTDSGWAVLHRSHQWMLVSILLALLSLAVAFR